MRTEEYEMAIGKLVIIKLSLTHHHHSAIDDIIEDLTTEYIDRLNRNEL